EAEYLIARFTMNPFTSSDARVNRREAIRRTMVGLGVVLSPSILEGVLHAQAAPKTPSAKPRYLMPKQFATASAVAERIIPKADTAGAREVGVPGFIDLMYGDYLTPEEKATFAAGLADVEAASTRQHKRIFAELTPEQQDGLLTGMAAASQGKEKS